MRGPTWDWAVPAECVPAKRLCLGEEVDGDDEAVEAEDLCEDEDEDHADEEARLLRRPPHAGVAHDADGVAGRQSGQTYCQTRTQMQEAPAKTKKLSYYQQITINVFCTLSEASSNISNCPISFKFFKNQEQNIFPNEMVIWSSTYLRS